MHGQNRERCMTAHLYHSDLCFARGFHRYAQESTLVKSVVCFLSSKEYYSPIKGQQEEQGKGGKKERKKERQRQSGREEVGEKKKRKIKATETLYVYSFFSIYHQVCASHFITFVQQNCKNHDQNYLDFLSFFCISVS